MKLLTLILAIGFLNNTLFAQSLDRFQGSVLGAYLGDALGKGVEYAYHNNPDSAPKEYTQRKITKLVERSGVSFYTSRDQNQPAGTYTDDTEETIGILDSLVRQKGVIDQNDHARSLYKYFYPVHGYSGSTQALIKSFDPNSAKSATEQRNDFFQNSPGKAVRDSNGCAMRISSVGVATHKLSNNDDIRAAVYKSCSVTHPAPASMEGAALLVKAIHYSLTHDVKNFDPEELIDELISFTKNAPDKHMIDFEKLLGKNFERKYSEMQDWQANIKTNLQTLQNNLVAIKTHYKKTMTIKEELKFVREQIGVSYATSESVPAALFFVLKYYQDIEMAYAASVHAALAGDTDTVPAMMGSVLGALHGFSALPQKWVDQLYDGTDRWKKTIGYKDRFHEELTRTPTLDGFSDRYVSYKTVLDMVEKLYNYTK